MANGFRSCDDHLSCFQWHSYFGKTMVCLTELNQYQGGSTDFQKGGAISQPAWLAEKENFRF